ncbi:glycoside hydrolase family 15 [Cellulomonas sp. PhB143]|uniref:glycoside hydrolase family 15 n=1 Tax=Cellulomonas sp. PhB143 TaxID=2485186 RepID=UPI000FAB5B59|nr:GH15 family glucan-1,4-alpha-glucosidase [Cellulomonas sp. PhB143]
MTRATPRPAADGTRARPPAVRDVRPAASAAVGAATALALALGALAPPPPDAADAAARTWASIPLYQEGVAAGPGGTFAVVPAGSSPAYLPGSRVLAVPSPAVVTGPGGAGTAHGAAPASVARTAPAGGSAALAARSRGWVAAGDPPGSGTRFADLGLDALLDLRTLAADDGAVVAGPSPFWRYVWPRDAAFAAVALARTGHPDDAVRVLSFLQSVQGADGTFEARYLPDGSGVPDDRPGQSDGPGWAMWAVGALLAHLHDDARDAALARLSGLVTRSTDRLLAEVDTPDGLPRASSDYWELPAGELTLGTAAPILAGLEASARVAHVRADPREADAATGAARLRTAVEETFGPAGYPRTVGGSATGTPSGRPSGTVARDAATAFLLPPFQPAALTGAERAWRSSVPAMLRPAGGLAPGGSWRADGVSWTPQTALYALAAASTGDQVQAEHWLDWLDAHRTATGALPEKVLADGSPAAVAPLAWTSALVVLALAELDARRPGQEMSSMRITDTAARSEGTSSVSSIPSTRAASSAAALSSSVRYQTADASSDPPS